MLRADWYHIRWMHPTPRLMAVQDATLLEIAERHGRSPADVLVRSA